MPEGTSFTLTTFDVAALATDSAVPLPSVYETRTVSTQNYNGSALFYTSNVFPDAGEVVELRCTYDPESRGGRTEDGRKVKGTIHWVSAQHAMDAEVRLYDHLFKEEQPDLENLIDALNPNSLEVLKAKVEPALVNLEPECPVQFERLGYFVTDPDSKPEELVFNRTVGLRDSWAKIAKKLQK